MRSAEFTHGVHEDGEPVTPMEYNLRQVMHQVRLSRIFAENGDIFQPPGIVSSRADLMELFRGLPISMENDPNEMFSEFMKSPALFKVVDQILRHPHSKEVITMYAGVALDGEESRGDLRLAQTFAEGVRALRRPIEQFDAEFQRYIESTAQVAMELSHYAGYHRHPISLQQATGRLEVDAVLINSKTAVPRHMASVKSPHVFDDGSLSEPQTALQAMVTSKDFTIHAYNDKDSEASLASASL